MPKSAHISLSQKPNINQETLKIDAIISRLPVYRYGYHVG